jgi:membrane-associated protease RseP (regulator of RpoE activity)
MSTEQKEQQGTPISRDSAQTGTNTCPNCHATMPGEMRFCRACGYRLGEGVQEYAETVRLPGAQPPPRRPTATSGPQNMPNGMNMPPQYGPVAPNTGGPLFNPANPEFARWRRRRGRKRAHWIFWMIIIFAMMSVVGGINRSRHSGGSHPPTGFRPPKPPAPPAPPPLENGSYIDTSKFKEVSNGVSVSVVNPPDSALDKAGLVGGDIITSFDGTPIQTEEQLKQLFAATPIGKTVAVLFIRDGETKTAKLTTLSEDENDRLDNAFDKREPKGEIGLGDLRQADVPGMNIKGVQIRDLEKNLPAAIAGIQKGDIVTAFNDVPIRTPEELKMRIERALPKSTPKITLFRGTEKLEIPVTVGEGD